MRYLSLCSGIEAATLAWKPLGWEAAAFSEIESFPCAVLQHHYPDVPNLGDMTEITDEQLEELGAVDLLVGGTPCQDFSVAGNREGMAGERGSLTLRFLEILGRVRPRWVVWENVPGVLSSNGGRDFGALLGGLAKRGYGFAYRVLDAQHFGIPQRRRRVFVVGHLGDWRRAAAVLLERASLRGDSPPRREAGARVAACLTRGAESSGKGGYAGRRQEDDENIVSALSAAGVGTCGADDNQAQGGHLIAAKDTGHAVMEVQSVRRLLPVECERLMGMPDHYNDVPYRGKPAADGPRYKAIGNSMAVPVMRWLGERIGQVDSL